MWNLARLWVGVSGILLIAIFLLYAYDPMVYSWFPKCQFYQLTGLQCPACGSQRAVHAALHADFYAAFRYNPFMLISIPYAVSIIFASFVGTRIALRVKTFILHQYVLYAYVILLITWWIVRNL